jgi:acetyl-CoA acetyltransferase family protein
MLGSPWTPAFFDKHDVQGQGIGAELIADQWEIPRSELDELALRSHQKAAAATEAGKFEREIVPVQIDGQAVVTDQGIRPDTSLEALAKLKPVFREENGRVTAGTSSQISDGASAILLMTGEKADALGLTPLATIVDVTLVGCDPVLMLEGPIPATRKLLADGGLTIDDIDVVEINEAFASVVVAWERELKADMAKVNPNGGAIAIGHPLGATGTALLAKAVHELVRADGEHAVVTMCCGGGLGTGTLLRRG